MKALLTTIIAGAVLALAIPALGQYTPMSKEDLKVGVVYDASASTATPWYLAPGFYPEESYAIFMDDFLTAGYIANGAVTTSLGSAVGYGKFSETADRAEWLVSVTDGDGDNVETIVVVDGVPNGVLAITPNNKADDAMQIQKNGESFRVSTTKDLWFETSIGCEDVSDNDVAVGLTVSDTDVLGSFGNDFMLFYFPNAGVGTGSFQMAKNGTIVTNAAITVLGDSGATGTNLTRLGFFADGSTSNVYVYVDGALVASNTASASLPNDELLSPFASILDTTTTTDQLFVDYIKIIQQR